MIKGALALSLCLNALGAESTARVVRSKASSTSKGTDYCSSADSGALTFVASTNLIQRDDVTGIISRWDEKDYRSPLVAVSTDKAPIFGGDGMFFSGSEYLRTCSSALGLEACDSTNQYQQFVTASGQSVQLSFGIQTYSDITKPQLLFSAENFGANNLQVWIFPPDETGSSGARLGRFGISWVGSDGTFVKDLTVPTCFARKNYNMFTVQITTSSSDSPSVRYFKDGILLTSDIDASNQSAASSVFTIPKTSPVYTAITANCGETFKVGCGGIPSSLAVDAAQCFEGKLGAFSVRRTTLTDALITSSTRSILGDYLGLRSGEVCGDGILGSREQCDDSNLFSNDGCGCDCVAECPSFVPPDGKFDAYIITGNETGRHVGASRNVTCQTGYDAFTSNTSPEDTVVCAPNQQWTAPNLACRKQCEELVLPTDLSDFVEVKEDSDSPGLKSGAARILTCKAREDGRNRSDWGGRASQTVRCLDGVWSQVTLLCEDSCGSYPQLPAGLQVIEADEEKVNSGEEEDFQGVTHGSRFRVQCDNVNFFPAASTVQDLTVRDSVEVICRHGNWSDINLRCFSGCNPYPVLEYNGYEGKLVLSTAADYTGGVNVTSSFIDSDSQNATLLGSDLQTLVPHGSYVELSCQEPTYSRAAGLAPMEKVYCADGHWTVTSVNCKLQCPSFSLPTDIDPASMVVTEVKAGTASGAIRRLECAEGYSSILFTTDDLNNTISTNSQDVKCLGGLWEQPSLRCKKTCDVFPTYDKKYLVDEFSGGVEHGAKRLLQCAEGYNPISLGSTDGSQGTLVVSPGLSEQYMQCVDGKWTQRLIDCVRDCEEFPSDETLALLRPNAFVKRVNDTSQTTDEQTSTAHGASRLIGCDLSAGTSVVPVNGASESTERLYCVDGSWNLPSLRCRSGCEAVPSVTNAVLKGDGLSHGSTRNVTCAVGYASVSGISLETLTCRNGVWSPSVINCEIGCGSFPSLGVAYSIMSSSSLATSVGSSRSIQCASGYGTGASQTATSTCTQDADGNASWSSFSLQCGVSCDQEYSPGDGYESTYNGLASHTLSEGATRIVRCATGYSVFGGSQPATVTCSAGAWTTKDLVCYKKCSEFPTLAKQFLISGSGLSTGSTRDISCASGFFDSAGRDSESVTCMNGIWSKRTLDCRGKCSANVLESLGLSDSTFTISGVPEDSAEEQESDLHGARRRVSCTGDYSPPAGSEFDYQETVCENGSWASTSLVCLSRCSPAVLPDTAAYLEEYRLPVSTGGSRALTVLETPGNQDGLIRRITCGSGYKATRGVDPAESVCTSGAWSDVNLVCKKACSAPTIAVYMKTEAQLLADAAAASNVTSITSNITNVAASNVTSTASASSVVSNSTTSVSNSTSVSDLAADASSGSVSALIQLKMLAKRGNAAAKAVVESYSHGDRMTLQCDEASGWFADSASARTDEIVCVDGAWTPTSLTCQRSCSRPDSLNLASFSEMKGKNTTAYILQNTNYRSYFNDDSASAGLALAADTLVFACASGYASGQQQGQDQTLTCLDPGCDTELNPLTCNARWTGLTLDCQKNCNTFVAPTSFVTVGAEFVSHGSSIKVSCAAGFSSAAQTIQSQEVVCNNGSWTPLILECELPCANPIKALASDLSSVNMEVVGATSISSLTSLPHGSTVEIGCLTDYGSASADDETKQTETLVCDRGTWSTRTLTCNKSCGDLSDIDQSVYEISGAGQAFGAVRPVSCRSTDNYYPLTIFDDDEQYASSTDLQQFYNVSSGVLTTSEKFNTGNATLDALNLASLVYNVQKRSINDPKSSQVICQNSGSWTQNTLICDVGCPALDSYKKNTYGSDGYIFTPSLYNSASGAIPGDSYFVTCDSASGFEASSPASFQVMMCAGGRWTEKSMQCDRACSASALPSFITGKHSKYYSIYSSINMPDDVIALFDAAAELANATSVSVANTTSSSASVASATSNDTSVDVVTVDANGSFISLKAKSKSKNSDTVSVPDLFSNLNITIYDPVIAHGQSISISCASGYSPTNIDDTTVENKVLCNDGTWTDITLRCARDCPAYQVPTVGSSSSSNSTSNSTSTALLQLNHHTSFADFRADTVSSSTAYVNGLTSTSNSSSLVSGVHTTPTAKVVAKSSDQPHHHGDWVDVSCDEGNGFASQVGLSTQRVYCDDGRWTNDKLNCMSTCGDYTLPSDAQISNTTDGRYSLKMNAKPKYSSRYAAGQSATVSCQSGYIAYGSSVTSEQSVCFEGRWTPIHLRCRTPLEFEWSNTFQARGGIVDADAPDSSLFAWRSASDGSSFKPMGDSILKTNKFPSQLAALVGGQLNIAVSNPSSTTVKKSGPTGINFYQLVDSTSGQNSFRCIGQATTTVPTGDAPAVEDYFCVNSNCIEEIAVADCTTCDKSVSSTGASQARSQRWTGNDLNAEEMSVWGSSQWWLMSATSGSTVPSASMLRVKWSCIEACPSSKGWNLSSAEIDHIQTWSGGQCSCTAEGCKDANERTYDLIQAAKNTTA